MSEEEAQKIRQLYQRVLVGREKSKYPRAFAILAETIANDFPFVKEADGEKDHQKNYHN